MDSTTLESTLSIKDDDFSNDSSTIFSTSSVGESTTINVIEDLSSQDDTTTTTTRTTTTTTTTATKESTTLLPEASGIDTVTELHESEEEKMHNVTVRNKNTTPSTSGKLEQDFEHANSTVSVQTNRSRITNKSRYSGGYKRDSLGSISWKILPGLRMVYTRLTGNRAILINICVIGNSIKTIGVSAFIISWNACRKFIWTCPEGYTM